MKSIVSHRWLLGASAFVLALASSPARAEVSVVGAWARATVPAQKASGAFMQIVSTEDAKLVGAKSPVAGVTEIHQMSMAGGVMKMAPVAGGIALPAGKPVALEPGGYHVMLMRLGQQLKPGTEIPLTLTVETAGGKRESIDLKVPVKPLDYMPGGSMSNGGGMKMKH